MLAADAFGVMPPIAKLTPAQAMYHFLSGYTAKVAGTERGLGNEPQPEFSTCFGSPFLPLDPSVYGNMLRELIAKHNVDCWLVNTGWTGGKYGIGRRMPIKVTRALLTAALDGSLRNVEFRTDQYFGFAVPTALPGVRAEILDPVKTWKDKAEFDKTARSAGRHVPEELRQVRSPGRRRSPRRRAGPQARGRVSAVAIVRVAKGGREAALFVWGCLLKRCVRQLDARKSAPPGWRLEPNREWNAAIDDRAGLTVPPARSRPRSRWSSWRFRRAGARPSVRRAGSRRGRGFPGARTPPGSRAPAPRRPPAA